jgi:hypothetical protein
MIMDELNFMKSQIARLPTGRDHHGLQYGRAGDPLVRSVLAVLLLKGRSLGAFDRNLPIDIPTLHARLWQVGEPSPRYCSRNHAAIGQFRRAAGTQPLLSLPRVLGDPKPSCRTGAVTIRYEFVRAFGGF